MLALTILMSAFIIAVSALMFFIWSQRRNVSSGGSGAAQMIFAPGEIGTVEEPAASPAHLLALQTERNATRHASDERGGADAAALQQRIIADASSASLVRVMLASAVFWLLLASFFGLISSIMTIVTNAAAISINRDDLHGSRFVIHLQFFAERLFEDRLLRGDEDFLFRTMSTRYPRALAAAERVRSYVEQEHEVDARQAAGRAGQLTALVAADEDAALEVLRRRLVEAGVLHQVGEPARGEQAVARA